MRIDIKLASSLYNEIVHDLDRAHPFAGERVGFVMGRMTSLADEHKLVLLTRYNSIPDRHYVKDNAVGARIGPDAMTSAMQAVYHGRKTHEGIFHVHIHEHRGPPGMSGVDRRETPKLIPGFKSMGRTAPHGIIILSRDHGSGWVWLPDSDDAVLAQTINVIGAPIHVFDQFPEPRPQAPSGLPTRTLTQSLCAAIIGFARSIRAVSTRKP